MEYKAIGKCVAGFGYKVAYLKISVDFLSHRDMSIFRLQQ